MSDVETIERDWDALLGESAERDWNALLGESGCAVKMLNRRRGKEPGRWLYELSVVPEIGVVEVKEDHVEDGGAARSVDILEYSVLMIWWTYESHNQTRQKVAESRAEAGKDMVSLYSKRIKSFTERWDTMWESQLPLVRQVLCAFFKGEQPELQELFLEKMRGYWVEDGPWAWAYR